MKGGSVPGAGRWFLRNTAPCIFALSGVGKLWAAGDASFALVRLTDGMFSYSTAESATRSIASVELLIVFALFMPTFRVLAASAGIVLGLAFSAISITRWLSGNDGPCGCFGQLIEIERPSIQLMAALAIVFSCIAIALGGRQSNRTVVNS